LGFRLPTSTHKKFHVDKTSEMPQGGLINTSQFGYKEMDDFGTWNVQTIFETGALISSLSQQKKYMLDITALQKTRWQQGKDLMDMKSHTLFCSAKENGTRGICGR